MKLGLKVLLGLFVASTPALGDGLEESYKAGYKAGKVVGYQEGLAVGKKAAVQTLFSGTPGTVGQFFDENPPPAGTIFQQRPDLFVQVLKDYSNAAGLPDTLILQGKYFDTIIKPITGTDATIDLPSDGSVAIIPKKSLDEIRSKLGNQFIDNNMTLNNDSFQ